MTTPGGVPNLPKGALTLETLQSMLQDMTPPAMRGRAAQRIPGTYDASTGGNPLNDLTPFGILTMLFAGFNSHVANADPADIQGPDDLPGLLLDFIESLPVVGQLVGLLEAILGTYDGDDAILLEIQKFFGLFRDLFGLIDLDLDDLPTVEEVWQLVVTNFIQPLLDLVGAIGDGINAILGPIFNGLDLTSATPAEVWTAVATAFLAPLNLFAIPADVQASINESLGHLQDALEGNYSGSGPIFLAVQALAEAWLKATDPLNAANLFGRIGMPQLAGGVSLSDLTTATSNLLDPFTADSVPTSDGWSFNSGQDAAQVVADGSTKGLWLKSGVIKVEEDQPVNTTVKVKYSGISSGAGQTIRYVLETYESEDGSGPMVPVVVGSITNPTGTISSPVTLGDTSWDIPAGVQSVRPLLEVDELVTAGTVYWVNTPVFRKTLLGVLSDGLPAALQKPLDDLQATWDKFKGGVGGTVDDIEDALNGAGQAIRDALANALGHAGTGHTSANLLSYFQAIPQTVVSGLGDLNTLTNQIRDILAGLVVTPINSTVQAIKDWFTDNQAKTQALNSSGQLAAGSLTGSIANSQVPGLGQIIDAGVQGAANMLGSGFGIPDFLASLADLQSQVASANRQLAQLQSTTTGGNNSGKSYFINIGDYADAASPPSIFTKILDTGAGSVATSSGVLAWQDSGSSAASEYYVHNAGDLLTDYFEVHGIMPRRSETEFLDPSYDVLWARGNAAGDTRCFLRFGYQRARMGCVVTGTTTLFGSSDTQVSAPAGSRVTFRGGTVGGIRVFQMLVNGDVIDTVTDTGNVSQVGTNYRKWGWGMEAAARFGGQATPGTLSALAANDNVPAPVVGSGFRISGTSSLNNVEAITPDMSWNAGTLTLTVNTEGWYLATLDVVASDSVSTDWTVQIRQAGVVKSQADYKARDDGSNRTMHRNAQTTTGLYLKPGANTVQPVIIVDTSSTLVHFECILLNKSTL